MTLRLRLDGNRSNNIRHRTWTRQGRSFVQCLGDASDAPDRSDKCIRRQRVMPDAFSVAMSRCESPTCRRCLCSSSLRGPGTKLEATHARAALLRLGRADADPRVEDAAAGSSARESCGDPGRQAAWLCVTPRYVNPVASPSQCCQS